VGDCEPRTSGLPCLSAASALVPARVGVDAALSLRHVCLWIPLLRIPLLFLSGSLPVPASVNSCRTPGPSQAISASWLVVVKMRSSLPARRPSPARFAAAWRSALALSVDADRRLRRFRAGLQAFGESVVRLPWPPSDVTR